MKRNWEIDELIEYWTLLPDELALLGNKTGATRLGFAVFLKYFQLQALFPPTQPEIPAIILNHIASQVNVPPEEYQHYDWSGRMARYHRNQIRELFGFRKAKAEDAKALVDWLVENVLNREADAEHLKAIVKERFRDLKIEPPTLGRIERLIRSALRTYENQFFQSTLQKLSSECQAALDALLQTSDLAEPANAEEDAPTKISLFRHLNSSPGRASLNSLLGEISKLQHLRQIGLADDLFRDVSPKVLQTYSARAVTEDLFQLRAHPDPIRYTLVAAFCWLKTPDVTDNLVDLLIQMVHGIGTRAERKVDAQLIQDFKRVAGKHNILYRLANASLEQPEGKVKEVIYPVVGQQILRELVKELKANGTAYQQKVHTVIRSSYSRHYRRALPKLLCVLKFRSNNDVHRPVIEALELLKKYADSSSRYYSPNEQVPIEGVLKSGWQEILIEKDIKGQSRINRINYEICVLQSLRERLRCKEIWVVGANRYRNPEEDLPTDFEQHRAAYYQALKLPEDASRFITSLKQAMEQAMTTFNDGLPKNPKVTILNQGQGRIRLSPLEAQPEPTNIGRLKTELIERWPMTSLLDILKEADLRISFTDCFKSLASREALDRETLQKRLLLCLYGLGTNTGLKRVSYGTPDIHYHDLRYVKRRFIQAESLRVAIASVVNAIFRARHPHIWGEGTTTCASDSKKFGATDQNLMTEWHVRYGGPGIMIYWHVEKKSTCIYSQLKSCSSSEVAAMIEGVLRHDTEMTVKKNFTDSHGQSEVAFAFCHLLGFQLMPRLKAIKRQKLYRPEAGQSDAYPNLQPVLTRSINWDLIRQQYDQMVKYATALRLGTAEPEAILRRFTRANLKHPTYQALGELGKVLKTLFLCQYLHSEALRREIHEGLNVVEQWNSTNGFILYGKSGEFATNQRDEQVLVMLSLHLLQVCLVYINTLMLQRVLGEPAWEPQLTSDDRRALTPLIYGHVNPYGTFRLDMEKRLVIEREVA
jgi:TnpA family transposase